jgi:hypothetical protein
VQKGKERLIPQSKIVAQSVLWKTTDNAISRMRGSVHLQTPIKRTLLHGRD